MDARLQEQFKKEVENYEKILNRKLTDEEYEKIKKSYDNPVAHNIAFRKGEVDIRELTSKDYRQLEDRNLRDLLAYQKNSLGVLCDIYALLVVMTKKMGVKDPFTEIDNVGKDLISKNTKK